MRIIMNTETSLQKNFPKEQNINSEEKLPYEKPELISYGKVKNITKGGNSLFFDEDNSQPLI